MRLLWVFHVQFMMWLRVLFVFSWLKLNQKILYMNYCCDSIGGDEYNNIGE